jgi:hypothetical protein
MTDNPTFTQGPWYWDGDELMADGGFLVLSAGIGKSGGAYLSMNKEDRPIFAATPELYDALHELLTAHKEVHDTFNDRDANDRAVNRLIAAEKAGAEVLWKALGCTGEVPATATDILHNEAETDEPHLPELAAAREIIAGFLLWHDPAYKPSPSESLGKLLAEARVFIKKQEEGRE